MASKIVSNGARAADDGGVGCLTFIHQLVPLDVLSLGTQGLPIHKSTIALLQQLKGILRCHRWVCRGANLSHLFIDGARGCCRCQGIGDLSEEAHGGCEMQQVSTGRGEGWFERKCAEKPQGQQSLCKDVLATIALQTTMQLSLLVTAAFAINKRGLKEKTMIPMAMTRFDAKGHTSK